jgi:hypothetical protein
MAQYLVVAHQTSASSELVRRLKDLAAEDTGATFVLLVPMTATRHLLTYENGNSGEIATNTARDSANVMRRSGLIVSEAIVGSSDPLVAVRQEYTREEGRYASVVISTLPSGMSRWLGRDLANQVRRQLGATVIEVVSRPGSRSEVPGNEAPVEASSLGLRGLALWRGTDLTCVNGYLGPMKEIVYDYVSLEPVWLTTRSHPLPFKTILIPVSAVSVTEGRLAANLTREKILGQPPTQLGEGFASLGDEELLCRYFGLPNPEMRDMRVLREGEEYPGLVQTQQAIFQRAA